MVQLAEPVVHIKGCNVAFLWWPHSGYLHLLALIKYLK